MRNANEHYDGTNPEEPLAPEHLSPAERRESEQLGDGSPGVAPSTGAGAAGASDVGGGRSPREPESPRDAP